MKFYKLSILAGCISLIMSSPSWSDNNQHSADNGANYDNPLNALFQDSHADIDLRTLSFNKNAPKKNGKKQSWDASALGAIFNFNSGYAWNHVGFDWSIFNTFGLDHGGSKSVLNDQKLFLPMKNDKRYRRNLFVPAGVAAIKFKAGNDDVNVKAKAGCIDFNDELLAGSSPRAIPSTYRGIHADANMYGAKLYAAVVNGLRIRSSRDLRVLKSNNDKRISYIATAGGDYTFGNGIGLGLAYGNGRNYMNQYAAQVTYDVEGIGDGVLKLKGKGMLAHKGGSLWNGKDTTKELDGFKKRATTNSLSANYVLNLWNFGVAYTKIHAKGGSGKYQYKMAPKNGSTDTKGYGCYNVNTASGSSDYNLDGERSYQASVGYNFDTVPGLSAKVTYTQGSGIRYKQNPMITVKNEHEMDYSVAYAFQQPALKGLQVRASLYDLHQKNVDGRADRTHTNTHDFRVFADYKIAVF